MEAPIQRTGHPRPPQRRLTMSRFKIKMFLLCFFGLHTWLCVKEIDFSIGIIYHDHICSWCATNKSLHATGFLARQ